MALSDHAKGYLITLAGVAIITPDTLLLRLAAVEPLQLAGLRGLLGGVVVLAFSALWYRRGFAAQLHGLGLWALAVGLVQGVGMVLFVSAVEYTSVANVLIFFAVMPLIVAVMAWMFLGERVPAVTWAAILAALAGLVFVASGSLGSSHIFGDMLALLDSLCLATFYVLIRRQRAVNMIPAMGLGLLAAALLTLPFAGFPSAAPQQWLWIGLGGLVVVPFGLMLLTLGPRYLAAPEVAVLMLLETVIGPFWVWLVLAEQPGPRSLTGGAFIITVLFVHALVRLRQRPAEA